MKPKQILTKWLDAFNKADFEALANLYSEDAVNHQVANEAVVGKVAIRELFMAEFKKGELNYSPVHIFEDGDWAILEWKDPKGLRGSSFFNIKEDKIVFQRGYWDKMTMHKLHNLPMAVI